MKAGRKIKKGSSPEEAGIMEDMLETYGEIAGKYDTAQSIGMSRLPYCASKAGMNIFQGGFFANDQWEPRVKLQVGQPSMQPIYKYEMNYFNSCGYWLGLQKTCFSIIHQVACGPANADTTREMSMLNAWAEILGEYALRVLAVRQEFYRNSVKDPVGARLNQEMYEEDSYLPVSDALDERTKQMGTMREAQLMKAIATLAASNNLKRAGGGAGPASQ